jgi:hypothetical protein
MSDDLLNNSEHDQTTKRGPHRWRPGESGNPRGRPRNEDALAVAIREHIDPRGLVSVAVDILRGEGPGDLKLKAATFLADRGYARPTERHEVVSGFAQDSEDEVALDNCTLDELRELRAIETRRSEILAAAAARTALPAGDDVIEANEPRIVIAPPIDRAESEQHVAAQPHDAADDDSHPRTR